MAIRKLAQSKSAPRKGYKLASVNMDDLQGISTSAALVLTAELSKWDDEVRQRLTPKPGSWKPEIRDQLFELGFFDLFRNSPELSAEGAEKSANRLVKYIKGRCGDSGKTRLLKEKVVDVVGDGVEKWTFLHSGLDEAITNVSHHAYPVGSGFYGHEKTWYLTGSYDRESKELKIVFYDQGVGIPKSLPVSKIWERVIKLLSGYSEDERKLDKILLKAAVEVGRTSTKKSDRGKGLQDLLEFVRQRRDGYISILSLKGLFKLTLKNGVESIKSESFKYPICGTLIIWSVTLK
ncbi:MAG: hypothetical protein IT490_01135 [Candidatus Contendobacter sp.]|nr:hypothetical protein [Candidatus Contendobacter sp.]